MGEQLKVRHAGALSLAGSVISAAMGFAFTFMVTQGLGAQGAGVVFQAMGIFSITWGLAKFGMDSVSIYLLPRLLSDRNPRLPENLRWIGTVALLGGILAMGLLLLIYTPGSGEAQGLDAQLTQAIGFTALLIPAAALCQVLLSMARGMGDIAGFVGLGSIALPLLRVLLAAIGIAAGAMPAVVALLWALPFPVVAAAAGVLVWRRVRNHQKELARLQAGQGGDSAAISAQLYPSKRQRQGVLRYGAPRTIAAGVEQLNQWLDVLIVGAVAGLASAGIYGGVMRLMVAALLVDNALRAVVSPIYSRLLHEGDGERLRALFRTTTSWLVVSSNAIYLTMAVFAPVVLGWLGPEFVSGRWALVVVCVVGSLVLTAGNVHSLLLMSGRSGLAAMNKVAALVVGIGCMLALLPAWGLIGAAVGRSIGMALDAGLAFIQVRKATGLKLMTKEIWSNYVVSAALVVGPQLLVRAWLGDSLIALLVGITISGLILAIWWLKFRKAVAPWVELP